MNFVELTQDNGKCILIDLDKVLSIQVNPVNDTQCQIDADMNYFICVMESYETVKNMMKRGGES
ncbi:hypothetical protein [Bacillus pumilus]|uniref:hypothetical protein n=1 Tax=Bacillus pumilus TaxID=1408 RepID=UPI0007EEE1D3|nr:hypothetical protein [Bacillus pumilus]MCW4679962.1 hypothetical protein [Bacillus pumilus]OBS84090.1 hypothetical protein BAY68_13300 [Bacillus pumilus]